MRRREKQRCRSGPHRNQRAQPRRPDDRQPRRPYRLVPRRWGLKADRVFMVGCNSGNLDPSKNILAIPGSSRAVSLVGLAEIYRP